MNVKLRVLRANVTRVCNQIEALSTDVPIDKQNLRVFASTLKSHSDRLEALNTEYEATLDENNEQQLEVELQKFEDYRTKIALSLALVGELCDNSSNAASAGGMGGPSQIRLPKLTLPIFFGDVLKWMDFYEAFISSVDSSKISDVEKFTYLKQHLKDEALGTISGLALTGANYATALRLLTDRYGNKQRRMRAHVRELMQLSTPNFCDVRSMRAFVDTVKLHVRALDSLGVASDHYEIFLCEILIIKVSNRIKYEWAKLPEDELDLTKLLTLVETEARTQDLVDSTYDNSKRLTGSSYGRGSSVNANTVNAHTIRVNDGKIVTKCIVCDCNGHKAFQCNRLVNAKSSDEKLSLVKLKKLCFNCLNGHHVRDCKSNKRCLMCNSKHHTLLHRALTPEIKSQQETEPTESTALHLNSAVVSTVSNRSGATLPVISVPVVGKEGVRMLNALLDTGSQRSFILQSELSNVRYTNIRTEMLRVVRFGGLSTVNQCNVVQVSIDGCDSFEFVSTDNICSVSVNFANKINDFLRSDDLPTCHFVSTNTVGLLIGADYYYRFVTGNIKRLKGEMVAVETIFGWTIQGPSPSATDLHVHHCGVESLDIKKFWDLETIGIKQSSDEAVFTDMIEKIGIHRIEGRYCVGFPWKDRASMFGSYEVEAKARLAGTWRKLLSLNKLSDYDAIFKEYLSLGIIEQVPPLALNNPGRYLPHHAVIRDDKTTTKTRIVFDASAKGSDEPSLNDCMHEGPNMYPTIVGILSRFRLHRIAATADVEKAFLQVGLHKKDRDFVRFLWYGDAHNARNIQHFRFSRVVFGVKASPFLLCAVIRQHLQNNSKQYPCAFNLLYSNIYMDDIVFSLPDCLSERAHECVALFSDMKMNLRKWQSNDTSCSLVQPEHSTTVLGLHWNISDDNLSVKILKPALAVDTKRKLASFTCGIFDPLGFFAPYVLQFKLFLRSVWQENFGWDDLLPSTITTKISCLLQYADLINGTPIPRWIGYTTDKSLELHGFGDASTVAYGCVVYARVLSSSSAMCSMLVSKTRLCPSNTLSVPKLELLAATITSRLIRSVSEELSVPVSQCHAWSDSKVCLCWISKQDGWREKFVEGRVREIQSFVDTSNWHFIATDQNPADLITRTNLSKSWLSSPLWWGGPKCLNDPIYVPSPFDPSIQSTVESCQTQQLTTRHVSILDFSRFSSYSRLRNCIAYVIRFSTNCRSQSKAIGPLLPKETERAECAVIRLCQNQAFETELLELDNSVTVDKDSRLFQLAPFRDDAGILRSRGRLAGSDILSYDERYPIILPNDHRFTSLLIQYYHCQLLHVGCNQLLNTLRNKYWILRSRRTVKSVVNSCLICRRYRVKACSQPFAPLPKDRCNLSLGRPFEHSGLDYFGPIVSTREGRKFYVLLFTCLLTRAVHLEATHSLDCNDFIKAFDRFISRRGRPLVIRSDNAKTFVSASKVIEEKHHVTWRFSTSRAPWTGGVWERMVRSVKTALKFVLAKTEFSYVELCTSLCKVEFVINERPITYVAGHDECLRALSPNDFLLMKPSFSESTKIENREQLLKLYLNGSRLLQQFWKKWRLEYLRAMHKNCSSSLGSAIKVGDIVLLNNGCKRVFWPLCRVIETFFGSDNKVRTVKLLCQGKTLTRPTKLLYNLELVD